MATAVQTVERENYLNSNYGIKSWLLTTDHKRIAMLYLVSITAMFWIGGFFAMMIRLELLTPQGDLVSSDTYNKLFTMHGIIDGVLLPDSVGAGGDRQFRDSVDGGRQGPGLPAGEPAELVHLHAGRDYRLDRDGHRRRRYRLDLLYAVQHYVLQHACHRRGHRYFHYRLLVDSDGIKFHRHDSPHAGPRPDAGAACRCSAGRTMPPRSSWCWERR